MSNISYVLIIKTGDAEIRGVENLSENIKNSITPLIELTPSRKSKKKPDGDIFRRLSRFKEAFGSREFIIDLTSDPNLANEQIEELQYNDNGYENWCSFIISLQKDFPDIIPVIQISDLGIESESEYYKRIIDQVTVLNNYFNKLVYRFPLEYEDYIKDIENICKVISSDKLICVIDAGFITQEKSPIYSPMAISVIKELINNSITEVVMASTSFPRNPTEFGGDKYGEYELEECNLFETVCNNVDSKLIYGDYATINPVRSLQAGGRGWVPRIDMPTESKIFYHRDRKSPLESSYRNAYIRIAQLVCRDNKYIQINNIIDDCWGIEQIELSAEGSPQGFSPSFWISVRMNIHITIRDYLI